MGLSLRIKLILAFIAVAFAAIAGIVLYANLDSSRQLTTYMARGGAYGVSEMVLQLEQFYRDTGSWDGVDQVMSMPHQGAGRGNSRSMMNQVALIGMDKQVEWSNINSIKIGNIIKQEELSGAIQLKDNKNNVIAYLLAEGAANLQVGDISPFVQRIREVILWAGILAAIAAIGLAILISNQLLKPVKALTEASAKLSAGELSTRITVKGRDELAVLGQSFNDMAQNLEIAEERKKVLTADVAHELRTPIAVQKAQIEAMLDGVIPLDQANLMTVAVQTEFLSRMVDDLRLLAMADAGELRLEKQLVNIPDFATKVVDHFLPQTQKEGTSISICEIENAESINVWTDPDRLMQIFQNLISNAMRYGTRGGIITIEVVKENNDVIISVIDDGLGIPESALPHLFERFYRHEKARDRETGGTGLGLAISKKLAVLMGGDLNAQNHGDGGAIFKLHLPLFNNQNQK